MDNIVSKKIQRDIKRMLEDSEFAQNITHAPGRGSARESALRELFQEFLPEEYKISQNVYVIDTSGNTSNECDLVIHQKYGLKSLLQNGNEFIPIECVRYVIEVKSRSTKSEISKSIRAANKLGSLKPATEIANLGTPISCYFSFSSDLKTEHSEFKRYIDSSGGFSPSPVISVLCDVDLGYYYFENRFHQRFGITDYSWSAINSDRITNVKMFMVGVLNTLNRTQPFGYYAADPGAIKFVYFRNLVDDYEILVEKHLDFLAMHIALDEDRPLEYIEIAEQKFSQIVADRLVVTAWKMLMQEGNPTSAEVYRQHLLGKENVEPRVLNQIHR